MLPDPAPRAAREARRALHPQRRASNGACQRRPVAAPRASTQASAPARARMLRERPVRQTPVRARAPQPHGRAHRRGRLPRQVPAGPRRRRPDRRRGSPTRAGPRRSRPATAHQQCEHRLEAWWRRRSPELAHPPFVLRGAARQFDTSRFDAALGATIEERWLPASRRVGVSRDGELEQLGFSRDQTVGQPRVSGERGRCDGPRRAGDQRKPSARRSPRQPGHRDVNCHVPRCRSQGAGRRGEHEHHAAPQRPTAPRVHPDRTPASGHHRQSRAFRPRPSQCPPRGDCRRRGAGRARLVRRTGDDRFGHFDRS